MKEMTYTIRDEDGIHARPAGILVKKMQEFSNAAVTIVNGEKKADAKKLFQLMKLGVKCGDTITVTADGPDGDAALAAAKTLLEENL